MPKYIKAALHQQDAPHKWNQPVYGQKLQSTEEPDDSPYLTSDNGTLVQQIVRTFLYYAMVVNNIMLVTLGSIATQQSQPTTKALDQSFILFNYAVSNPNVSICYRASDMMLYTHIDPSYLSKPKARSRADDFSFLATNLLILPDPYHPPPPLNGPIFIISKILHNIMSSAVEAEIATDFLTAKEAVSI